MEFLRSEVDRLGDKDEETRQVLSDFFGRAVKLELDFFDAAYAEPIETN